MKKAIIEITASTLLTLLIFAGTGIYKIYTVKKKTPEYQKQEQRIKEMQDKYCGDGGNKDFCIELLKLNK